MSGSTASAIPRTSSVRPRVLEGGSQRPPEDDADRARAPAARLRRRGSGPPSPTRPPRAGPARARGASRSGRLNALDTVLGDTPAARATATTPGLRGTPRPVPSALRVKAASPSAPGHADPAALHHQRNVAEALDVPQNVASGDCRRSGRPRRRSHMIGRRSVRRALATGLVVVPIGVFISPAGANGRDGRTLCVSSPIASHRRVRARSVRQAAVSGVARRRAARRRLHARLPVRELPRRWRAASTCAACGATAATPWRPVWGEYKTISDHCNALTLDLRATLRRGRAATRVPGLRRRRRLPLHAAPPAGDERDRDHVGGTEFNFAGDFPAWSIPAQYGPGSGDENLDQHPAQPDRCRADAGDDRRGRRGLRRRSTRPT